MTRVRRLGRDTFASLRNRNYRLYFIGQIISVSGTWMQRLAQAWLILELTHNNGIALGVESGAAVPADAALRRVGRRDRRPLRQAPPALRAPRSRPGCSRSGSGSSSRSARRPCCIVYLFSVLLGFVNVIDNPARQTFVMEMVGRDELPNAVGLNSVVMNSSRVVGPAIGGIVIEVVGLAPCFFFNAASYVAVIVALCDDGRRQLLHRCRPCPRAKGQLREGFRYVWSDRMVRTPLLMMAVIGTLAFNFQVVIPLIVDRDVRARRRRASAR